MPSNLEPIDDAGLPLLIGLDKPVEPIVLGLGGAAGFPFSGGIEPPLIGVMFPVLLGMLVPAPGPLLKLPLLPRGMKVLPEPEVEGELIAVPDGSSMGEGT